MPAGQIKSRTVLFGGTFDPIHDAHLEIARAAVSRFGLRRVLFIPAANPPHKSATAQAPYEDRVHMAELACMGEQAFEVSRIEEASKQDPHRRSYSILTIEKLLAAGVGSPGFLSFLIGADAFAEIRTWHRWEDVIRLVEFIVVDRPGAQYAVPAGASVFPLTGLQIPLSSSEIREALAAGSSHVPVQPAVLHYIREHGLYRFGG